MKKIIVISIFSSVIILMSCNKNELVVDNTKKADVINYVVQLSLDYSQASLFHSALMPTTSTTTETTTTTTTDHSSHHIGGSNKVSSADISYNKLMFAKNDSLFSDHYFKYCIDMLKNGVMVIDSTVMKGNTMTTMGTGNMMNGESMGKMMDNNKMLAYMDSLHLSLKNSTLPDYMRNDSIMHDHILMCKTISSQTNGIENIYNNMLILRRNHKLF